MKLAWLAGPLVTTLILMPSLIFCLKSSPQLETLFSVKNAEKITICFFAFLISSSKGPSKVEELNVPVSLSFILIFVVNLVVGLSGILNGPRSIISLTSITVPLLSKSFNIFLRIEVSAS